MIIGIVGQIAVGKGVLVKYLVKKFGFYSFSLSSIVHEELKKRKIKKFDRKTLQDIGNDLRKKYGDDVLAKRAVKNLKSQISNLKNFIIEGIRNPSEVAYIKSLPNSFIIGIKAKRELRFKRLLKRAKPWDPKNWNDFLKIDRRDLGKGEDKSGQNVSKCLAYCDYVLTNNKDKKDFEKKVGKLTRKIFNQKT
ncbi:MAG: AAA family ATPase [Patescibacteria group bacterium]|nr:AAA family ATPase [Patescibacteria group bacterium]